MIRRTTDGTIQRYCTRALIELLHDNRQLETVEQMFIENHLALLRTAYDGWKRRSAGPERLFYGISQEGKKSVRLGVLPRQPSQRKTYIKDYRDCPRT